MVLVQWVRCWEGTESMPRRFRCEWLQREIAHSCSTITLVPLISRHVSPAVGSYGSWQSPQTQATSNPPYRPA